MSQSLKVLTDTFFKINTQQSGQLTNTEKVFVRGGQELAIASSEKVQNHYKLELSSPIPPEFNNQKTWYVFASHIQIQDQSVSTTMPSSPPANDSSDAYIFNPEVSYQENSVTTTTTTTTTNPQIIPTFSSTPTASGLSGLRVKIINNTVLKLEPKQSTDLNPNQKLDVLVGQEYELVSYENILGKHLKLNLKQPITGFSQPTTTVYVFADHVQILGEQSSPSAPVSSSEFKLKVITNTYFKLEPKQSEDLLDAQKHFMAAGQEFRLKSSEKVLGNHLKITLIDPIFVGAEAENIWYVFADHVQITGQPANQGGSGGNVSPIIIVDPKDKGLGITLKVLNNTFFKEQPVQSSDLTDSQKVLIEAGKEFILHSHDEAPRNHVKVALANAKLGPEGKNTWYVFAPHIEVDGTEPNNKPNDPPDTNPVKISPQKTGPFKLPGYGSTFYLSDPIIPGGHFSWAEATKNGTRIPANKNVVGNIIKIAHTMEDVREYLNGRTITVNSWYRDPVTNRRIGGASLSRHMVGDAVDFTVAGISPPKVNKMLDSWWGSKGGIASASCFTHIDQRGYRARWSYGF